MGSLPTVTAQAGANIALVKYWGKRDVPLNVPAADSLSLTLDSLTSTTTVRFDPALSADTLELDGAPAAAGETQRVSRWLDQVRERAGMKLRAEVKSQNNFPTASGLASSASAYAALALAASRAAGLELSSTELSLLARRGSGSAARSVFAGLVLMHAGERADGRDAFAEPIDACADWPLRMVVAVVGGGQRKKLGSTDAMERCRQTSPLYPSWLATVPNDIADARRAVGQRDFELLGRVTERSTTTMHASALAARPAIWYFQPPTLACMDAVIRLREQGVSAYFTMDAGPHVKVLTLEPNVNAVKASLQAIDGVSSLIESKPGPGVRVI